MKEKDKILKITLSALLVFFGIILLLDQLNVPYIDEFFTPWYTIVILFFVGCLLAFSIIKKSPICYTLTMFLASIYLIVSILAKAKGVTLGKIIAIVPLFVGLGLVIADTICKWSPKAKRLGCVITASSAVILVSTILDVWKIVIPVVLVAVGIAYIIFILIDIKRSIPTKSDDHYVTIQDDDQNEKSNENGSETQTK